MVYPALRDIFAPKRVLEILSLLQEHERLQYSEIESDLDISSETLSSGLNVLQRYDLIKRYDRSSRVVEYEITDRGRYLCSNVEELEEFLSGN